MDNIELANVNETVQEAQGGKDITLYVPPGAKSLPEQQAEHQTDQAAMVPDTSARREAVQALSAQWGSELAGHWLADPQSEATQQAVYGILKSHWGEGYQENLNLAREVISNYASPALRKALETSGLGNDPSVIMFAGALGAALQQATHERQQAQKPAGEITPPSRAAGLDDQIASTMADPAYFDDNHPLHKQAVAKAQALFAARYRD